MPQQPHVGLMNAFNKGLKTEFTGLNFPEDAATSASNVIFNRIGNTTRRPGINYETNFVQQTIDRTSLAISTYKWNNVGGDGSTRVLVTQIGPTLRFYKASSATTASPLSAQLLASTIDISSFVVSGSSYDSTKECQFSDGNGYLFVVHPSCDPFYIVYTFGSPDTVAGTRITVKIRDFSGIPDGLEDTARPPTLSAEHQYNLQNQGWTSANPWSASLGSNATQPMITGAGKVFVISTQSGALASPVGKTVRIIASFGGNPVDTIVGTVSAYTSPTSITLTTTSVTGPDTGAGGTMTGFIALGYTFNAQVVNDGFIATWFTAIGSYPANADQWWTFKTSLNVFDPAATIQSRNLNAGPAPKGYYILEAFNQQKTTVSGVAGLTSITTTVRPKTTCWFQGRVWYAGTDAQQNATGDAPNYTWTENIYFSQIIEREDQFGKCYQTNDPTSETLFDLLPTDGGTVKIQGCGSIFKLFSFHNGLLVFAANGVWYITGSQGIGFAANDYTITKLSSVQSISGTSFVDVQGAPWWWNEEAIYTVVMADQGTSYGPTRGALSNSSLSVQPITYASIQTFYDAIPVQSKKYVRGDYDMVNWDIRWVYRTTNESSTTDRYQFDGILTYNTITQGFSPWSTATTAGIPYVHGVDFIQGPGGSTSPLPILKYLSSVAIAGPSYKFTFAEENDTTNWVDWHSSGTDYNYTSTFTVGYMVHGKGLVKSQQNYVNIWLNNTDDWSYRLQGIWDFAISGNSGKFTSLEKSDPTLSINNFAVVQKRQRIPGRGYCMQFKFTSVTGKPFDIIGWAFDERINQSV